MYIHLKFFFKKTRIARLFRRKPLSDYVWSCRF